MTRMKGFWIFAIAAGLAGVRQHGRAVAAPSLYCAAAARHSRAAATAPPLDVLAPRIIGKAAAMRDLGCQGYRDVTGLQQVWDYWEGSAKWRGKHVTVYVLPDGGMRTG
jgi:hypothetical protein